MIAELGHAMLWIAAGLALLQLVSGIGELRGTVAVVGQRFEVVAVIAAGFGMREQRAGNAGVQRAPLMQADRGIDDVAGDAVLEAQAAGLRAGEDQVGVGQARHARVVERDAGRSLEQPAGNA